jgi:hypothetical protein
MEIKIIQKAWESRRRRFGLINAREKVSISCGTLRHNRSFERETFLSGFSVQLDKRLSPARFTEPEDFPTTLLMTKLGSHTYITGQTCQGMDQERSSPTAGYTISSERKSSNKQII